MIIMDEPGKANFVLDHLHMTYNISHITNDICYIIYYLQKALESYLGTSPVLY